MTAISSLTLNPPLTNGPLSDESVLPRVDTLVIGPLSIHVDSAVDQPSTAESNGVSENGSREVGIPQSLSPELPGHQCREHKTHEHHTDLGVPMWGTYEEEHHAVTGHPICGARGGVTRQQTSQGYKRQASSPVLRNEAGRTLQEEVSLPVYFGRISLSNSQQYGSQPHATLRYIYPITMV